MVDWIVVSLDARAWSWLSRERERWVSSRRERVDSDIIIKGI